MDETKATHPVWRFRAGKDGQVEQRLFPDIAKVPARGGWVDSPAKLKVPKPKLAAPKAIKSREKR